MGALPWWASAVRSSSQFESPYERGSDCLGDPDLDPPLSPSPRRLAQSRSGVRRFPPRQSEVNQIVNGNFTSGTPPGGAPGTSLNVTDGELCADVPGGTVNPWDAIIGQDDVPLIDGESYAFSASLPTSTGPRPIRALVQELVEPWTTQMDRVRDHCLGPNAETYEFASPPTSTGTNAQVAFQVGGSADPWTLLPGQRVAARRRRAPGVRARHRPAGPGQPGRLPARRARRTPPWSPTRPTRAALAAEERRRHRRRQRHDHARAASTPAPGRTSHTIDFSAYTATGTGYTLVADGETSHPFDIDDGRLRAAARRRAEVLLHRSAAASRSSTASRPGYARPAGHVGVAPEPGRHRRALPARRLRLLAWTSPAAGTTPATTASTSSTAASRCTSC